MLSSRRFAAALAVIAAGALVCAAEDRSARLVVHEWGTFTSLQDEAGRTLRGINVDDEPVPGFVHRVGGGVVVHPPGALPPMLQKGLVAGRPDVAMRLETPVMYFYPPAGSGPVSLDVEVGFRGGWLTEYYPDAAVETPGLKPAKPDEKSELDPSAVGRLVWRGVRVGGEAGAAPATDWPVWTTPRRVAAATVTVGKESERYLFYRGVGNLEAPLRVERAGLMLRVRGSEGLGVRRVWMVDVRADGAVAFEAAEMQGDAAELPGAFAVQRYEQANLGRLKASMQAALVEAGLYTDEAEAMLGTWEAAYFKSAGQRVMFLVPEAWTESVLPLKLSVPAEVRRVMVGRIELVTPGQRELMRRIAEGPTSELKDLLKAMNDPAQGPAVMRALQAGRVPAVGGEGAKLPRDYQAYVELGRFRNALLLDERGRRGGGGVERFVTNYGLR